MGAREFILSFIMNPRNSLVFLLLTTGLVSAQATQPATRAALDLTPGSLPEGYELLHSSDASSTLRSEFGFSDPSAWSKELGGLHLIRQSAYKPPVRSPVNIALWKGGSFDDFILDAEVLSTGREYGHLDMCVFFGVQARDKFYYAHIAQAADDHAHNLFRVDGKPRVKFATKTTKGIRWGKRNWHKVRLVREGSTGKIELYFDDMKTPIMVGQDKAFVYGQVGFGSFDDTGKIGRFKIYGKKIHKPYDLGFVTREYDVSIRRTKDRCFVELGGKPFAQYRWDGKPGPFLWPVLGPGGKPMTRGWPVGPWKAVESKDHPHHRSLWFAHGAVNGHDFWSGKDGAHVVQTSLELPWVKGIRNRILTKNDWVDGEGKVICRDERTLRFSGDHRTRILDVDVRILASEGSVDFGETKEGTMAIRMQTMLRLAGKQAAGQALNSEGITGAAVWGKRARWVAYWAPLIRKNPKEQRDMGLALIDHPDNHGYPCHWHARDYGLLAANPFGSKAFGGTNSEGHRLDKGKTLRLRYRFVFFTGPADKARLNVLAEQFGKNR